MILEWPSTVLKVRNRLGPSVSQRLGVNAVKKQVMQVIVGNPTQGALWRGLQHGGIGGCPPKDGT